MSFRRKRLAVMPGDLVAQLDGVTAESAAGLISSASIGSNLRSTVRPQQALVHLGGRKIWTRSAAGGDEQRLRLEAAPTWRSASHRVWGPWLQRRDRQSAMRAQRPSSSSENRVSKPVHRLPSFVANASNRSRRGAVRPCDLLFCIQCRIGAAPDREQRTPFHRTRRHRRRRRSCRRGAPATPRPAAVSTPPALDSRHGN